MHKKVTKRTREENKGETNTREVKRKRRVSVEEGEEGKDARSNGDEDDGERKERRGKVSAGGSSEKQTDAKGDR